MGNILDTRRLIADGKQLFVIENRYFFPPVTVGFGFVRSLPVLCGDLQIVSIIASPEFG
jgi:hypothetical protein